MYKKYVMENDYYEWTEKSAVYRCKKDIKCDNGVFENGSLVMLHVCNSDLERIYVIDFMSVCIRVKNNPFECDYVNHIKMDNLWDSAVIPVNMMGECFEKADEVNQDLKNVKKSEKKVTVVAFMLSILALITIFALIIFCFNISVGAITVSIVIIALEVSGFIFIVTEVRKLHNKFCDSIMSDSGMKKK